MEAAPSYRCSLIRGGTSKGAFFLENELPPDPAVREQMLLRFFGSPDPRQIDGVGGGISTASKAMIVGPSTDPLADVTSRFGQVSLNDAKVDWGGNCGNLTSAVGIFAVNQGLVPIQEPVTPVRILNLNTGKRITAYVEIENGKARSEGQYSIPGIRGTGSRIDLEFHEPGSTRGLGLLPTGHAQECVTLTSGKRVRISVVDAANVLVFARASDLDLVGSEQARDLTTHPTAMAELEEIRSLVAEKLGIVADWRDATTRSPGIPKIGFVAPPADYTTSSGEHIPAGDMQFQARVLSMQSPHRAYMVAGAIATAVASRIPGTVVHDVTRPTDAGAEEQTVRFGHPAGMIDVRLKLRPESKPFTVESGTVGRTARVLMSGQVYL